MSSLVRKSYSLADKSFEIYIFVDEYGTPWFKAKEVAQALGYTKERDVIQKHVDSADKMEWGKVAAVHDHLPIPSNWQPRTIFVNESGLYDLVWHSRMPFAKEFKRWVKCEVLPSIRKTGAYVSPSIDRSQIATLLEMLKAKDDQLAEDRKIMAEDRKQILALMTKMLEDKPKIAVMPMSRGVQQELRVYNKLDKYRVIRAQRRNVPKAVKQIPRDYALVMRRENVPNAVSPLNRIKELIAPCEYRAKNNEIETKRDVVEMLEKLLHNLAPPPAPPAYEDVK